MLIIDEAAHVENMSELWTGLYPTLSTGGRCIALSTPNGVGNWFIKHTPNRKLGKMTFILRCFNGTPTLTEMPSGLPKKQGICHADKLLKSFECNFNTSGETVFHADDIDRVRDIVQDPKYRTGIDRNLWIWEEYQSTNSYMISADVARGDANDYSAFLVFKLETMEIVAEYHGKITIDFLVI